MTTLLLLIHWPDWHCSGSDIDDDIWYGIVDSVFIVDESDPTVLYNLFLLIQYYWQLLQVLLALTVIIWPDSSITD